MPIGAPAPQPTPTTAPAWFLMLTATQRKTLLGWLRVRKVDTTSWPK